VGTSKKGLTRTIQSHDIPKSEVEKNASGYAVFVANQDPSSRLPDFLFSKFVKIARSIWIKAPSKPLELIVVSIMIPL